MQLSITSNKKRYRPSSPPPADAENYQLIQTREGPHWRRKRGTVKKAKLNSSFKKNVGITSIVSPAAAGIRLKLNDFLAGLQTGRFIANVSALLRKGYKESGELNFSLLKNYEMQPYFHLSNVFTGTYIGHVKNGEFIIEIRINKHCVKKQNKNISGFFFEAVLLSGDLSDIDSLRVESDGSSIYKINSSIETNCKLSLSLPPKKPWMVLLKVNCMEGNQPAFHPRHYGMKVVGAG